MMWLHRILAVIAISFCAIVAFQPARAQERVVDVMLVLLVDVSASVDDPRFELEREGLARAIESREVVNIIQSGSYGRVAIQVIQWSTAQYPFAWHIVHDAGSAAQLARSIREMPRRGNHSTFTMAALQFAEMQMDKSGISADRWVIDLATDGRDNGPNIERYEDLRARFEQRRIQVNVMLIGEDEPGVAQFHEENTVMGPGAFMLSVPRAADFGNAMIKKLTLELASLR